MRASYENDSGFRLEGRNPVLEALRSGKSMDKIMIAKDAHGAAVGDILKKAHEKGIVVKYVEKAYLDKISEEGQHQGVIAQTVPYEYKDVDDILTIAANRNEKPFLLILDSITDPHNFGAILRTAECAGAHGVIIPKRRAVGITASVVKASAGALEYVTIAKVANIPATIDELKEQGLWVIGADPSGTVYTDQDFSIPLALVIGGEDKGISRLIREKCDFIAGIPLRGKIDSLNASVAAALLLYEVVRQRA
jgi:23S rRNA (guanosine2251-2'-O)-methyltransferase